MFISAFDADKKFIDINKATENMHKVVTRYGQEDYYISSVDEAPVEDRDKLYILLAADQPTSMREVVVLRGVGEVQYFRDGVFNITLE